MKPITAFLTELRPAFPGIDETMLKQELNAAIREFYTKGSLWLETLPAIDLRAGKDTYYLNPQPEGTVLYIAYVEVDGIPQRIYDNPNQPSGVSYAYSPEMGAITLSPTPSEDKADALVVNVVMKPRTVTQSVPNEAVEVWFDTILDGTKARLYAQPKKSWTNDKLALLHGQRFRSGMATARDVSRRRYTFGESTWRFPFWA